MLSTFTLIVDFGTFILLCLLRVAGPGPQHRNPPGLRIGQVNSLELERHRVDYTFLATLGVPKEIQRWKETMAVITSKLVGGSFLKSQRPQVQDRRIPLDPSEVLEATLMEYRNLARQRAAETEKP